MANSNNAAQAETAQAWHDGRRQGLATAALAIGLTSFLNLLGAEKSILAIILAVLAVSGTNDRLVRRRASIAIGLSLLQIVTIVTVLVLFRDELGQLIQLLQKLG